MLYGKLILFSTSNRHPKRNLIQMKKKKTIVVQRKIVKVVGKVFAISMHCVFVSIIITMQINFIETLDLEIYQ